MSSLSEADLKPEYKTLRVMNLEQFSREYGPLLEQIKQRSRCSRMVRNIERVQETVCSGQVSLDFYLPGATTPVSCDVDKVGGILSKIGLEQLLTQLIASRRKVLEAAARVGLCAPKPQGTSMEATASSHVRGPSSSAASRSITPPHGRSGASDLPDTQSSGSLDPLLADLPNELDDALEQQKQQPSSALGLAVAELSAALQGCTLQPSQLPGLEAALQDTAQALRLLADAARQEADKVINAAIGEAAAAAAVAQGMLSGDR